MLASLRFRAVTDRVQIPDDFVARVAVRTRSLRSRCLQKIRGESLAVHGGDEADNSESVHARSHDWIFHG